MLVVSRREGDRISFPALGITVEVKRLGRRRASLGIEAPRSIRVIRDELLETSPDRYNSENLVEAVRDQVFATLRDEIAEATDRLNAAHQELIAGNTEVALETLSESLAQLDAIRSRQDALQGPAVSPTRTSGESAETESIGDTESGLQGWTNSKRTADAVSETGPGYRWSSPTDHRPDHAADSGRRRPSRRVLLVGNSGDEDRDLCGPLREDGFEVDFASDSLTAFYLLSRIECPEFVLVPDGSSDELSTLRTLCRCSRHPEVPVVNAAPV